jgi:hypothetical protein
VLWSREIADEVFHGLLHMQACGVAFSPPAGLDWTGTTLGLDGTPC